MPKARYLFAGALIALGCESETFDLLPDEEKAPSHSNGGASGDAGGTSGVSSGSAGGGAAGSAGRPPTGGSYGTGGTTAGKGAEGNEAGDPPCLGNACCNGPCPECREDVDCKQPPFNKCRELPEIGFVKRCVECMDKSECGVDQACHPFLHTCIPRCTGASSCAYPRPVCDPGLEICVPCALDSHCDKEAPHCYRTQCVQCVEDFDCGTSGLVCSPELQCRPCFYDYECGGFGRECINGRCREPTMP